MIAVVPVRGGSLPAGGAETVAECRGRALLVGEGVAVAAKELHGVATEVAVAEMGGYAPLAWAPPLAAALHDEPVVVLPASPDGRDLAPLLALQLTRPLLAGAIRVDERGADLARWGGLVVEDTVADGPFVATLQPGVRGIEAHALTDAPTVTTLALTPAAAIDAEVLDVLPPDVLTMDLAEAPRIVGGGAGLDSVERIGQLARVGAALGASMGVTRVVTDRHWAEHQRQIGTTGVVVNPRLYLAFAVSGAVQHTSGLGQPEHIVSVNVEPNCPMMQLADLPIVADANLVLEEMERRLADG
jgi:electron transfer flavoprotein alpha subunit